ncbi:DNA-binding transcriptional LysR family regulator [Actinoalloteichus hoggarensis]|uniref:Hca operon transcriptional activator n=1 Tax=Actinoalloteichus hoggarensis TaxID=1470176 RepID=A0A221W3T9_9PSEU|nr:LysR family transcriptional regulator [Actinoalloteichus hoggarensis]ASO20478.1 Hca operon transcriptional activator [Actinoalloteichus hoggarensis]MBB5923518.1 DNA-binding transcriptional LysR family regulator [Actinoalloteichus hoggarensis]
MELRALQYFVTVAEELHFGRAAQRLRIVQPAVSQQIARLERELGVRLLDRTSRRVRLTSAGDRVLLAARETLASAARVRVVAGEPAAALRIGVASCVTRRLDEAMTRLCDSERPTQPELIDLPVTARLDAVRDGELDLALVRGAVASTSVTVARAWSEPLHAVLVRDHPAACEPAVRLHDLDPRGLRLPVRDSDPPMYDAILAALPVAPLRPPAGDLLQVLFEVGRDPEGWTLAAAEQLGGSHSERLRQVPLDPPLTVDGHVVTSLATPESCVASYVAAFAE